MRSGYCSTDLGLVQHVDQGAGVAVEAHRFTSGAAIARTVGHQHAELGGELRRHPLPVGGRARLAVQQHDGRAYSLPIEDRLIHAELIMAVAALAK
jgi:hypothetical protein